MQCLCLYKSIRLSDTFRLKTLIHPAIIIRFDCKTRQIDNFVFLDEFVDFYKNLPKIIANYKLVESPFNGFWKLIFSLKPTCHKRTPLNMPGSN
jgi:hypothetical protein